MLHMWLPASWVTKRFSLGTFYLYTKRMASAYVRCIQGEDRMQITVEYSHEGGPSRVYNLDRKQTENVGTTLDRLKTNLANSLSKMKKKKKKKNISANLGGDVRDEDSENNLNIAIINANGQKIEETLPNTIAWVEGIWLKIGITDIPISVNLPTVKLLPLPSSIMAGFPIFPRFEMKFTDMHQCTFLWERVKGTPTEDQTGSSLVDTDSKNLKPVIRCTDKIYTPDATDIGQRLKLTCIPRKNGSAGKEDSVMSEEIQPGPGLCPFEARQLYTSERTEQGIFRVVTYNILGDIYTNSEFARDVLFSYCPPNALDMNYRRHLLLKEIAGYNADIICLQEVDQKVFKNDLLPSLDILGYTGALRVKGQLGREGSATFIHNSKFRIVDQKDIMLTDILLNDESCADLRMAVEKVPKLKTKFEVHNTVLQVLVLETMHQPQKLLCVANTHLYFHPYAGHQRLLQAAVSLRHLRNVCQYYVQQGKDISLVFCGDFNSTPEHGINVLMTKGHIPADFMDWLDGGEEQRIHGLELRHDFHLISACGYTDFTNYTAEFSGMLDYIFVDARRLSVKQVVPMPSKEEVSLHTGLPSVVFPSDHIAQICDLSWV